MTEIGAKKRRKRQDDPDARLAFVLLRYARGWWEQARLAAAGGFNKSQVAMWERGVRRVPAHALRRAADVTGFPRYLLGAALRVLRSFRLAARGRTQPRRVLAEVSLAELFPLAVAVLDLILEPLDPSDPEEGRPPAADDREAAEALLERLKRRTERQRLLLVEHVPEFRQRALADLALAESRRLAPSHPGESLAWSNLAARIAAAAGGSAAGQP